MVRVRVRVSAKVRARVRARARAKARVSGQEQSGLGRALAALGHGSSVASSVRESGGRLRSWAVGAGVLSSIRLRLGRTYR